MERQLAQDLGQSDKAAPIHIPLAVNADSLATWFCAAMAPIEGLLFQLQIDDQDHSADWLKSFRTHVSTIPEVIDFFRIGGDYDYMLKVVTEDMASYDRVYQRLISKVELDSVTSYFAMEAIEEQRPLPL